MAAAVSAAVSIVAFTTTTAGVATVALGVAAISVSAVTFAATRVATTVAIVALTVATAIAIVAITSAVTVIASFSGTVGGIVAAAAHSDHFTFLVITILIINSSLRGLTSGPVH